jgi:hypothetical protein
MSQDRSLLCISGFCGLVTFAMFVIGVAMMMEAMVHMFGATLNKQCCFVNLLSLSVLFLNIAAVVYGQCVLTCGSSVSSYTVSLTGAPKLPPSSWLCPCTS